MEILSGFKVAKYKFILEAGPEGLELPPYKGSTFRGGFGSAFRRIVCSQKTGQCRGCLLRSSCPYAYIFETAPPAGSEALRNYESVPRPFVIEPPAETKTFFEPGESLEFSLVLVGKAITYLPYFIVVFRELGAAGVGKGRRSYVLRNITAINPLDRTEKKVYEAENQKVINTDLIVSGSDINNYCSRLNGRTVTVDYLTMTRLKYNNGFVNSPEFHVLIRNLLRRISSLMYFHHDMEMDIDFKGIIEKACNVKIVSDRTRWVDWERYSNRQNARMKLGGITGQAVYEGCLDVFWPLLKLGELVHVGKATTFGMGKYEMAMRYISTRGGDLCQKLK
ncbi:hypothetical protein DDW10_04845 [Sulfolobales archaeon SCGC AB-777_J03]|nr:hypothetical protein DDW10_04845 [Sulfolobales archaeon SCGC AB-777_J03]